MWKSSSSTGDVSEAPSTSVGDLVSEDGAQDNSEAPGESSGDEQEILPPYAFEGVWVQARISENTLTWNEGEDVRICALSQTAFLMHYVGIVYYAELCKDGRLHWDDNDVWTRNVEETQISPLCSQTPSLVEQVKSSVDVLQDISEAPVASSVDEREIAHPCAFEGVWAQAHISGNTLTWNEGEDVRICPLSQTTFRMHYVDNVYYAELCRDGRLHWDDNDVWTRKVEEVKILSAYSETKSKPKADVLPPWLARTHRPIRSAQKVAASEREPRRAELRECERLPGETEASLLPGIKKATPQDPDSELLEWARVHPSIKRLRALKSFRALRDYLAEYEIDAAEWLLDLVCEIDALVEQHATQNYAGVCAVRLGGAGECADQTLAAASAAHSKGLAVGIARLKQKMRKEQRQLLQTLVSDYLARHVRKGDDHQGLTATSKHNLSTFQSKPAGAEVPKEDVVPSAWDAEVEPFSREEASLEVNAAASQMASKEVAVVAKIRGADVASEHEENAATKGSSKEAREVDGVLPADLTQGKSKAPIVLAPVNKKVYQGDVKYFRGSYGWIVCQAVGEDYPGQDIMVHKNDCNFKPEPGRPLLKPGDQVRFRLTLNNQGNPQAVNVSKVSTQMINAKDWFNSSQATRSKLLATK